MPRTLGPDGVPRCHKYCMVRTSALRRLGIALPAVRDLGVIRTAIVRDTGSTPAA